MQQPDAATLGRTLATAGVEAECARTRLGLVCRLDAGSLLEALRALAAEGWAMLVDITGVDTGSGIELNYHLRSFATDADLFIRVDLDYDAEIASAWSVYPAALYAEREVAELLGMTFVGHPNPKRLLTSDEVGVYLLRKSTPIRSHAELVRPGVRPHPSEGEGEGGHV